MRIVWIVFCLIALAAAAAIWMFAAGWAGRIVFHPDLSLLSSGEWISWSLTFLLMYAPIAFAIWFGLKAVKAKE